MTAPMLEVRKIRKRYGSFTALHEVSFQVERGELFGLLGPNGAGKTTLLSILSALSDADDGQALLDGQPIATHQLSIRRRIGIGPQDLALYGELTAWENLAFFGRLYGLQGPQLRQRIETVLHSIGLADRAQQRAGTFSGGMKRRLNLGIAIMHQPELLLLDEPTTGVDPQSRNHIFEQVQALNAQGMTIIYTSHYMEEVQTLCKRIAILEQGRVLACDTLPNLLRLLPSRVHFRVSQCSPTLLERLAQLPDVRCEVASDQQLTLTCSDSARTVIAVIAILNELHIELTGLESQEPNLERVFLHLTGHALRD